MKNISFLLCVLLMISCKNQEEKKIVVPVPTPEIEKEAIEVLKSKKEPSEEETNQNENPLLGSFVGYFRAAEDTGVYEKKGSYTNKINISLDSIAEDSIYGHSVVAGNSRPFRGILNNETLTAEVSEPGDDKYDGVFTFSILKNSKELEGVWNANNANLAVNKREYKLKKMTFSYNPVSNLDLESHELNMVYSDTQFGDNSNKLEAIRPEAIGELNASTQQLYNKDIENLSKGELEVLRNFIYARHGYSFKNRKMRYFFDNNIDWYIPVSTDIRNQLTDLEKKNIDLIKRYEQHAERYYDYFGR